MYPKLAWNYSFKFIGHKPAASAHMIEFYQGQTSTNSGKVRLVLEEKNIPYKEIDVDLSKGEHKSKDYLSLNPNGVVPTIVDEGQVIVESSIINEYLDDRYKGPVLKPRDPLLLAEMRQWPQMIDLYIHPATWIITYVTITRPIKEAARSEAELLSEFKELTDRAKGERLIKLQFDGVHCAEFGSALHTTQSFFNRMEQALGDSGGPWILGDAYSLADVAVSPWFMRFENIKFSDLWAELPELTRWWQRVKKRSNFVGIVSRNLSVQALEKRSELGAAIWPEVQKMLD